MTGYVLGADLSRWQGAIDFGRLADDGVQFVIPKVAENGVIDPYFARTCSEAAKRNMLVAAGYMFVRPADNDATIAKTLSYLGGLPLAIDNETAGVATTLLDRVVKAYEDKTGREGLGYWGLYPPQAISDLFAAWPRWFPQYPGSDTAPARLPSWDGASGVSDWRKQWLIWQYSGTGRLPGIAGDIDLNRLACPLPTLKAWVDTGNGAWENAPPFAPPAPAVAPPLVLMLGKRDLHLHSTGQDVAEAQRLLLKLKYDLGARRDDGDFGPATDRAVRSFQASHHLVVDGWLGRIDRPGAETVSALLAATR